MSVITPPDDAAVDVADEPQQSLIKRITSVQSVWILGVLLVIVAFFSVTAGERFFSTSNFSLISQNIAVWAVLGVGMTFIIITSGIDLSIGSVLVFSSVVSALVMQRIGGDGWGTAAIGILAALVTGVLWGLVNGALVAKAKIPPLIVTLGTLSIALGLAQVITGGIDIRSVPEAMTDFSTYIKILGIPALPFVALVVVIIGGIVLHKTRFGRYTYAIGSNEESARRVGVHVSRHLIMIYALMGLLAGLGAVLALAQFGTTTIAGQSLTNLNVIAAVVIGGTSIFGGEGSIFGTVVGLFIPAVLQAGFVIIGVQPFWQGVAVGAVLIAAVWVDQSRRAAALRGGAHQPNPRSVPSQRLCIRQVKGISVNRTTALTAAGLLLVALPLAACTSSKPTETASPAQQGGGGSATAAPTAATSSMAAPAKASKNYNLQFIQGVAGDEFYITMQCGMEAEAAKLGVSVKTQGAQKFDPTLQKPIVDSVAAGKPDAILVAPTDVTAMQAPLKAAAGAGTKIVLVDTTLEDPSIAVSAIASDNEGGGRAAFEAIKQLNPNGGKVMVMSVNPGISTTDARAKGFEDAVKEDSKFQYLGVQYSKNEPAIAANLIGSALQKDPDLVGVFAANLFSAEGTATGVRQAGKQEQVKIVSFDAGPNQVKALKEGTVQALVAQQPALIGQYGVDAAVTALEGGQVTPKVQTGFEIITRDNVDGEGAAAIYKSSC